MESTLLSDKSVKPTDEIIFSIIGYTELLWKQTFTYLFNKGKDILVEWKYSDCGKYWVCIAKKKKNTLFRLHIFKKNSFSLAFPFGDKVEPIILQSNLPEKIKNDYSKAKRYNSTRYISVEMEDSTDLENVKKLIDIKVNN